MNRRCENQHILHLLILHLVFKRIETEVILRTSCLKIKIVALLVITPSYANI